MCLPFINLECLWISRFCTTRLNQYPALWEYGCFPNYTSEGGGRLDFIGGSPALNALCIAIANRFPFYVHILSGHILYSPYILTVHPIQLPISSSHPYKHIVCIRCLAYDPESSLPCRGGEVSPAPERPGSPITADVSDMDPSYHVHPALAKLGAVSRASIR